MATAVPVKRPVNRQETDRRVRHPLQALRGYIRTYVALEGAAAGLIFVALWFWLGLFVDYGSFSAFGFDWLKRLTNAASAETAFGMQVFVLVIFIIGLLGVVTLKVLLRLFREFSDSALALVLERRFPRELGDRLITAVEMADPKVAQKYGFSQTMIDQTIADAANRVERLPVRDVFNWARLYWHGALALAATVGMYLVVGIGYCIVHLTGPGDYFWEFNHVAGIWCERNVLLQDTYWPPHAYLELVRFPESERHPGEMRIARDENRPEVGIRAVRTVLFVPKGPEAPEGIRALRVADLAKLLPAATADIPLPAEFGHWVIDLDDLDPRVPAGAVPTEWQGKTSGQIRAELNKADVKKVLPAKTVAALEAFLRDKNWQWDTLEAQVQREEVRAALRQEQPELSAELDAIDTRKLLPPATIQAVLELLDWHNWSWDSLSLQLEREEVREALKRDYPKAHEALESAGTALAELIDTPSMRRTIRQLTVPNEIGVQMRGKITWYEPLRPKRFENTNKFTFPLTDLKESVTFSAYAEDYYTPTKKITLLPPPSVSRLLIDKEEPAYLYYRLLGDDAALKGKRQHFRGVPVTTTGPVSQIELPLGGSITVTASIDRDLKLVRGEDGEKRPDLVLVEPPEKPLDPNFQKERAKVKPHDQRSFSVTFPNVRRRIEFEFVFRDEDNVRGRRHVVIQPALDREPTVVVNNSELDQILRREGFDPGKSGSRGKDRFLITPIAYLPITGVCSDDRGLVQVEWHYELKEMDVKAGDGKDKEPGDPQQRKTESRAGLLAWALQVSPAGPGLDWVGPAYVTWLAQGGGLEREKHVSRGIAAVDSFRYNVRVPDDVTAEELEYLLRIQPQNRADLLKLLTTQRFDALVKELADAGRSDSFFGELTHLVNVPAQEWSSWRTRIQKEPADALRDLYDLVGKLPARFDWKATLQKDTLKPFIKTHPLNPFKHAEDPGRAEQFSFDVKKQLPTLRVVEDAQQTPYELTLHVQAIDNNVEAKHPGVGKNKTPMVFLVVSEDELLFEINKEEQFHAKQIKDTLDELEGHKTILDSELGAGRKLTLPRLDILAAVTDGLATSLRSRKGTVKGVYNAYTKILAQMRVNRIQEKRRDRVEFAIHVPLGKLQQEPGGDFAVAEVTTRDLLAKLDKDQKLLQKASREKDPQRKDEAEQTVEKNLDAHAAAARKMQAELVQLVTTLSQVLRAMEEIGGEDELRNNLIRILQQQRAAEQRLMEHYRRILEELIGELPKE